MRIVHGIVERVIEEHAGLQRLLVSCPCDSEQGATEADGGEAARFLGAQTVLVPRAQDGAHCGTAPEELHGLPPASPASGRDPVGGGRPVAGTNLRRVISYPALTGAVRPGDRVAINTTAVDLALGTGGWDIVTCVEPADGRDAQPQGTSSLPDNEPAGEGLGRIMKLRYAPCQVNVCCVEEQGASLHEALRDATDCHGLPVACCELHSQAMAVAAAAHATDPSLRIAYIMTDEAALMLPLSDVCRSALGAGVLATTITCGQASGGEHEAVSLHSALLAADALGCDAAVVSMGPGIVGTGTAFGHGGVAQGEAVNACAAVSARAIAPLRVSFADARPRHRGLSHHSAVALGRVALAPAIIPVPAPLVAEGAPDAPAPAGAATLLERQLVEAGIPARHELVDVPLAPGAEAADALLGGLHITTMGRTPEQDPAFFRCAAAAGVVLAAEAAARLASSIVPAPIASQAATSAPTAPQVVAPAVSSAVAFVPPSQGTSPETSAPPAGRGASLGQGELLAPGEGASHA